MRHLFLVGVGGDADDITRHDILQLCLGRHGQQLTQREHADQMVVFVGDIEIENHLHIFCPLQRLDGLLNAHVLAQRENLRRHDAAGAVFIVAEKLFDLGGILILHDVEDFLRKLVRHVADNIYRIIIRHFLKHFGDRLTVDLLKQLRSRAVIEFGQHVGRNFRVLDQVEENALLFKIEVTKEVRNICRMYFGKQLGEVRIGTSTNKTTRRIKEKLMLLFHRGLLGHSVKKSIQQRRKKQVGCL